MRAEIINGAESLFIQYGVRSVSMDDVARTLSVSKKTLYQHFVNKDELVTEVAKQHMEQEQKQFDQIVHVASNAIGELHLISQFLRENIFKINPSLLYDLQKYHREAWMVYTDFKNHVIKDQVVANIDRGVKEGYYREGLDAEVLAIMRLETVQIIFDSKVFPPADFDFRDVQMQVYDHFVFGLLSEKGKQLYQQYQNHEIKTKVS